MKKLLIPAVCALILTSCGPSEEEQNKIIEEAATMRAKQYCESMQTGDMLGTPMDVYGQYMNYLQEQLQEEGIDKEGFNKALDLYDKKIKESCPDMHPDVAKEAPADDILEEEIPVDTTAKDSI